MKRTKAILYTLRDVVKVICLFGLVIAGGVAVGFAVVIGIVSGGAWCLHQLLSEHVRHELGVAAVIFGAAVFVGLICWPAMTEAWYLVRDSYRRNLRKVEKK